MPFSKETIVKINTAMINHLELVTSAVEADSELDLGEKTALLTALAELQADVRHALTPANHEPMRHHGNA